MAFNLPGIGGGGGSSGNKFIPQIARDIWNFASDFVGSEFFGFVQNKINAAQASQDWDKFRTEIEQWRGEGWERIQQELGIGGDQGLIDKSASGRVGVLGTPHQLSSGRLSPEAQADIDAARGSPTTAIGAARAVGEEARGLGDEYFDPRGAVGRYRGAFKGIGRGLEQLPGRVGAANEQVQALYGGLRTELQTGAADLAGGYEGLLGTARGLVSSLGGQERRDINRIFDETGTELQMGLSARGLGGSTISSSIGSGVARERTDALGRLQDRLTTQQLGVEERFGLPGLASRERLLGTGVNLGAQQAGSMQFGNQLYAGTALSALGGRAAIAGGEVGAFDQAAAQKINNLLRSAGFQVDTQLEATRQYLDWAGPAMFTAPPSFQAAYNPGYGG